MEFTKVQLDERKQKILKAIVHGYIRTAEPVGSEFLVVKYGFDVKPATIRNEMARMSEMGYLHQPHTSAGRIPSDMGYRFYVDRLMPTPTLPTREASSAREGLHATDPNVEHIINQTCRILTGITHHTSMATEPVTDDTEVRSVVLSLISRQKLLLVIAFSNGCAEHRILDAPADVDLAMVIRLSNALSAELSGKTLQTLAAAPIYEVPQEIMPHRSAYDLVMKTAIQIARSLMERKVYLEGTNYVLKQPEFHDFERLGGILEAFEQRKLLYQMLSQALLGPDVTIMIGEENPVSQMRGTSVVASKYKIGERVAGTIAVVGPTRMDYRRAIAAVQFMAQNLSDLLTSISAE